MHGTLHFALRTLHFALCMLHYSGTPVFAVTVECYAGHRGEQTPRAIVLGDRRVEVAAVVDQWLAPDHRYFKVRGNDSHTYLVRHDIVSGGWELTMFRRADASS